MVGSVGRSGWWRKWLVPWDEQPWSRRSDDGGRGRARARPQSVRLFRPRPLAIGAYGEGRCRRWTLPGRVSNRLGHPWAGLALGVRRYLPLGWLRVGTVGSPQLPVPLSRPPRPRPTLPPLRNPRQGCLETDGGPEGPGFGEGQLYFLRPSRQDHPKIGGGPEGPGFGKEREDTEDPRLSSRKRRWYFCKNLKNLY